MSSLISLAFSSTACASTGFSSLFLKNSPLASPEIMPLFADHSIKSAYLFKDSSGLFLRCQSTVLAKSRHNQPVLVRYSVSIFCSLRFLCSNHLWPLDRLFFPCYTNHHNEYSRFIQSSQYPVRGHR